MSEVRKRRTEHEYTHEPKLLLNTTQCNKCWKEVESYAIYYTPGEHKEPTICDCEGNQLTIRTKEVPYRIQPEEVSTRLECGICARNTIAMVPEVVNKPTMVRIYCELCEQPQYHDVLCRMGSMLDAMLQESPQEVNQI
jgi:hypothetical protein